MNVIRQVALLVLTAVGAGLWIAKTDGLLGGYTLWLPGLLIWISQTMFWLGFASRDLKLLLYLSGAWVGVMACVGVLGTFVGAGVAASAERETIQVAIVVILLVPVALLPRFRTLWPGGNLPANPVVHLIRSIFVLLQFGGIGLLMISLIPVFTCVTTCG